MAYRKLNIEEDPTSQSFELEALDLFIAVNVLHVIRRMTRTLCNVRKLFKAGGKLLLVETTTTGAQFSPFGTVITGGFVGSLAYSFARWLTDQGAKYINKRQINDLVGAGRGLKAFATYWGSDTRCHG